MTCWPVVQAVAGSAVSPAIAARSAGAAAPAGVNWPGVPAVAPVATTAAAVDFTGAAVSAHSSSTVDSPPASPLTGEYGWGISSPDHIGFVADTGSSRRGIS